MDNSAEIARLEAEKKEAIAAEDFAKAGEINAKVGLILSMRMCPSDCVLGLELAQIIGSSSAFRMSLP